jgi:hypothetical protein
MFQVDGDTITLSRGDTGSVTFRATGHTFAAEDRALFTMKSPEGTIVKQGAYQIESGGVFTVYFLNADTDYLAPGQYTYDVRYVIGPYYDSEGKIVDGDQVITPKLPKQMILLNTVGNI